MKTVSTSSIMIKAIDIAVNYHKNDTRKGTKIPYLVHLFNVSKILAEIGAEDEVIAAGLLHDIVEDTTVTIGQIKTEFGKRVADIVASCTEKYKLEKSDFNAAETWQERKEHTVNEIVPHATADQLLVILADKLDNIRSIQMDYEKLKDKLWERFNAGKYRQRWYYKSLADAAIKNPNINEQGKALVWDIRAALDVIFTDLGENDQINIVIANDHKLMRDGLKIAFQKIHNYKVTGESFSFRETIEIVDRIRPDILLLDDQMPDGDTKSCIESCRDKHNGIRIIVHSWFGADAEHFKQIMPIINGWVSVAAGSKALIEAIETAYLGGFYGFIPGFRKKD